MSNKKKKNNKNDDNKKKKSYFDITRKKRSKNLKTIILPIIVVLVIIAGISIYLFSQNTLSVAGFGPLGSARSEEHTSELQSQSNLVCRLLLEKKNMSLTEKLVRIARVSSPWLC